MRIKRIFQNILLAYALLLTINHGGSIAYASTENQEALDYVGIIDSEDVAEKKRLFELGKQ